jgi:hypothetical protein
MIGSMLGDSEWDINLIFIIWLFLLFLKLDFIDSNIFRVELFWVIVGEFLVFFR